MNACTGACKMGSGVWDEKQAVLAAVAENGDVFEHAPEKGQLEKGAMIDSTP